ncbi:ABC transporter family protein, partial [Vibrio cholerae CP1035(8)]
NLRYCYLMSR